VIVVGLGHAGIEAALVAARLGRRVVAVVPERSRIGVMSCNPAIGGSGKSQLVRELDALGGAMALAADSSGIQFRRLNLSRGPAVHATRVLCDRAAYAAEMRRVVEAQAGLEVIEDQVVGLVREGQCVVGVRLRSGGELGARAVVITTGTFLSAILHTGEVTAEGGRVGEPASHGISEDLRALGLRTGRFKTGTPPRLLASSIDVSQTEVQEGDVPPRPLSFRTVGRGFPRLPQRVCWLTWTGAETHQVVRQNLGRSPLYQGRIGGRGPRYCPSLEDKVVRFADKARHAVFLEPEGVDSEWVYPAGLSTSLPVEVQEAFLRTIPGLREVVVARPGYAVEYDYVPATQLGRDLGVGRSGLFLAGQINGTSGYEEAAVQGFWAGVNAARFAAGGVAWGLARDRAHIGVLIEQLTRFEFGEPLRMFTSRAENRLALREGNADLRLATEASELGLTTALDRERVEARRLRVTAELERLRAARVNPDQQNLGAAAAVGIAPFEQPSALADLLKRPGVRWAQLAEAWPEGVGPLDVGDAEEVEAEVKYEGYLRRQGAEERRTAEQLDWVIPRDFAYAGLPGLSGELRERLERARPTTLGCAQEIPGMTSAALGILAIHLARQRGSSPVGKL